MGTQISETSSAAEACRLYLMQATSGIIKIGRSAAPEVRRVQLAYETRDAGLALVYATEPIENAANAERKAHRAMALTGKHLGGEWFESTVDEGREAIRLAIRQASGLELPLGGRLKPRRSSRPRCPCGVRLKAGHNFCSADCRLKAFEGLRA
jgi:hypothetical protein